MSGKFPEYPTAHPVGFDPDEPRASEQTEAVQESHMKPGLPVVRNGNTRTGLIAGRKVGRR